jgi:ATP-dependent DNA ligase
VSRHGVDWTLAPDGSTRFSKLKSRRDPGDRVVYYVFDVLYRDGDDLRRLPLSKVVLNDLLAEMRDSSPVQHLDHFACDGPMFFEQVIALGLEGVVSKRSDEPYRSTKNRDWLKTKNTHTAAESHVNQSLGRRLWGQAMLQSRQPMGTRRGVRRSAKNSATSRN